MAKRILIVALVGLGALPAGADLRNDPINFTLTPGVPIFVDPMEPGPITERAIKDLQRDLEKVLGVASPVVNQAADIAGRPAIVVTCTGAATASYRDATLTGLESHLLMAAGTADEPRMVLQGADTRGTIYAIYEFSDRFLDVPPLWYWGSWQPACRDSVTFSSAFNLRFESPAIQWRGWFPNDTDLLAPWRSRSPENAASIYEALLRLKYNFLDVNNISDFTGAGISTARECKARGIAVSFTHYTPFGADIGDWNRYWSSVGKSAPPLNLDSPTIISELEAFWTHYINLSVNNELEVIQPIVFRGHGDTPYWTNISGGPTDAAGRAQVIATMMARQVALLKSVTGNGEPLMRAIFYSEVADFMAAGFLQPPGDPALIWNFVAARRDHFPDPAIMNYDYIQTPDRPVGYYENLQFFSTGAHLNAAEGPWKMEANHQIASVQAGPGNFVLSVFNVGNIREFLVEISAGGELLWNLHNYISDDFLQNFAMRYFGIAQASQVAGLYQDYYQAYWQQKAPDFPLGFPRQYVFQDLRYARAAEDMLRYLSTRTRQMNPLDRHGPSWYRVVPADSGATDEVGAVINGTTGAIDGLTPIVSSCDALTLALPTGESLFNDTLCQQAHFMLQINLFLQGLAQAISALPDTVAALSFMRQAESDLRGAQLALDNREQGPVFTGWYSHDSKFAEQSLMDTLSSVITQYQDYP